MSKTQKNEFNISGRVVFVGMPIFYSDKLSKRIVVLEVWDDKYRNEVAFDFINKNMELLNNIRERDWVNIDFKLNGRKHLMKSSQVSWFHNLVGISCVKQD